MTVRTRFAPSPTGYLHIGGARTALFNWLFARRHGGEFVLRIEDTDRERSSDESVQAILDGMQWLNLDYDEGPFFQTQRYDRYNEVIEQLLHDGHAYHCYCSREAIDEMREKAIQEKRKPRYDGTCRHRTSPVDGVEPVLRFRTPESGQVIIDDLVKGQVVIDNTELDDLVIRRSDGNPTYNLTVVVDDIDMQISHVIRGDDHLNNTPRQIHIFNALGATLPKFAHLPMILGDDGKRMSKRHGAVSVMQYQLDGILPQAMLNYLARLGWSHGDQELFSREELLTLFDIEKCQRSGSVFDQAKLQWVNQQYIGQLPAAELGQRLADALAARQTPVDGGPPVAAVAELLRERAATVGAMAEQALPFYVDAVVYDEKAAKKQLRPVAGPVLQRLHERLIDLQDWQPEALQQTLNQLAADLEIGFGKIGLPLRVALTGATASPDIAATVALIGKPRTLARLDQALAWIAQRSG